MLRDRDQAVRELLDRHGFLPAANCRVLDVGCGTGGSMGEVVTWGAELRDVVGVDIDDERLFRAKAMHRGTQLAAADAGALPFPDRAFRLVVLSTLLSSVLDETKRRRIAAEIDRVLQPRGAVIWYDYRVSHPLNPHTRRVGIRALRQLFAGYGFDLRSITLVPQIARRVGRARTLYRMLAALPILRTHYVGVLRKPAPASS